MIRYDVVKLQGPCADDKSYELFLLSFPELIQTLANQSICPCEQLTVKKLVV